MKAAVQSSTWTSRNLYHNSTWDNKTCSSTKTRFSLTDSNVVYLFAAKNHKKYYALNSVRDSTTKECKCSRPKHALPVKIYILVKCSTVMVSLGWSSMYVTSCTKYRVPGCRLLKDAIRVLPADNCTTSERPCVWKPKNP